MTEPAAPPAPSRIRRLADAACTALAAGSAAGLALGVTLRDAWQPLAAFHYATPVALVIAASAAACLLAARLHRRRTALAGAAVAAAGIALLFATSLRITATRTAHASSDAAADTNAGPTLRGLLWNVEHGGGGWSRTLRWAASRDADLVVFIEGPGRTGPTNRAVRETFPGHAVEAFRGRMMVLAKGRIDDVRNTRLATAGGRGATADVTFDAAPHRPVRVVAIDLPSSPFLRREPMIAGALGLATGGTARTIVAGDFNTPRTSAAFDAWRGPLRHAWETAGTGFDATWPNPLPVLSIDQVWTDAGVEVLTCVHGGSYASDHRPVEFTFRITR